MKNDLEKYKIFQYIRDKELPHIVVDHFFTHIDPSGEGYFKYLDLLLTELIDLFAIVDDIYSIPDQSTFKAEGYFEVYRNRSVEILELGYVLLDNDRIDEIIYKLATTHEGHHFLIEQRRQCALDIQKLFFELLFSDHYRAIENSTTVHEIDNLILNAKHAKSRIALKYDPEYIPTEDIRQFVVSKLIALSEHAENTKQLILGDPKLPIQNNSVNPPDTQEKPSLKTKSNKLETTFESLFVEPYKNNISAFIDVLRQIIPPLINEDGAWIGEKNAARIYVNGLKSHGIIKPNTTQREAHSALGGKFPNLGSSFMKEPSKPTKADEIYYDIPEWIKDVKSDLSTESH